MRKHIRFVSLVIVSVLIMSAFAACTGTMADFDGDLRDRYDYNLKNYIKPGKYEGIKVKVGSDTISDSELQAKIIECRVDFTSTVKDWIRLEGDAVAEIGNIAEVKYQGYVDGEPMTDLVHRKEEGYSMPLGAETLIAGLDEHIIGMKLGEKKTVEITVPDPCYDYPSYVGKTVKFELELAGLHAVELEPYGEELFNYYGCSTEELFEAQLISEIKRIRSNSLEDYIVTRALRTALDETEVKKYPQKELDEIIKSARESDKLAAEEAGQSFEEYIKSKYDMTEDDYEADIKEYAESMVKSEMFMYYIARNEKLGLTNAAFDEMATELAIENGLETPAQYVSYMESMGYTEFAVREMIWGEMVADFIYQNTVQVKEG